MSTTQLKSLVIDDSVYETALTKKFLNRKSYKPVDEKRIEAFIPGLIQKVFVKIDQKVKRGEKLLVLEAMKMQNVVNAPMDGVIKVLPEEGKIVKKSELLIILE